jgi:hypothetical protein
VANVAVVIPKSKPPFDSLCSQAPSMLDAEIGFIGKEGPTKEMIKNK